MTIITWNCAMALQKKLAAFELLKSDIAIIQECSKSAIELLGQDSTTSTAWFGDNKNNMSFRRIEMDLPDFKRSASKTLASEAAP